MNGEQYVKQLLASWSSPELTSESSYVEAGQEGLYYYANMCHVCHFFGENASLKRCGGCQLISYCGSEHQKKDWPEHRDFCRAISQVKKDLNQDSVFAALKASNDPYKSTSTIVLEADARMGFKVSLMGMVAQVLQRQFKPHEIQIINHPRVCAVCFESRPEQLTNCKKCPQASFCKEHSNDPTHKEVCPKLLAAFFMEDKEKEIGKMAREVKIAHQMKTVNLPSTIKEFIDTYVKESEMKDETTREQSRIKIAFTSERFSRSLSVLFAMEKLNYTPGSKILIHVVGATFEEIMISDWEIILHWLPQLSKLELVLIGPNILPGLKKKFSVCKLCKKYNKSMVVRVKTVLYEDYFKNPNFKKPDMIAAFNAGIHAYPSWDKAVKVFAILKRPFLITSYNRVEAHKDQDKLSSISGASKCIYFQPNPFASMMYLRNSLDESTFSKNNFMLVYKHLHSNA